MIVIFATVLATATLALLALFTREWIDTAITVRQSAD